MPKLHRLVLGASLGGRSLRSSVKRSGHVALHLILMSPLVASPLFAATNNVNLTGQWTGTGTLSISGPDNSNHGEFPASAVIKQTNTSITATVIFTAPGDVSITYTCTGTIQGASISISQAQVNSAGCSGPDDGENLMATATINSTGMQGAGSEPDGTGTWSGSFTVKGSHLSGSASDSEGDTVTWSMDTTPVTLKVTANGKMLAAGDCASISADDPPVMPTISAMLSGSDLTGSVGWSVDIQYKGPDTPPAAFSFDKSDTLPVSRPWRIPFGSTFIGGDATLTYTYNGQANTFDFCVDGTNPATATVKDKIGPTPWYLIQIAEQESTTNLCQFAVEGAHSCSPGGSQTEEEPLFGPDHGFGIMQVDRGKVPARENDLFSWTTNIREGIKIQVGAAKAATSFWKRQVTGYEHWITAHPKATPPPPPPNIILGPTCKAFSYAPNGDQLSFSVGLSIQGYNGAKSYFVNWNDKTDPAKPTWVEGPSPYVTAVCNQPPY